MSNPVLPLLRRLDRLQQTSIPAAFLFAVQKKAGDDNAGTLIANLAYAGFVSLFPLLLVLVTVLGLVANTHAGFAKSVETSALSQFPIIGPEIGHHIHALHRSSALSLGVGLLGLVWGATGLSQTAMYAVAQAFNVPMVARPGFLPRLARSLVFLALLALAVVVAGFLSSYGVVGKRGAGLAVLAEIASLVLNAALYLASFRVLTPANVRTRQLLPGAIVGGVAWTVLQALGGYLVARDLKGSSAVYGFFGIVLGLLAWIYLAARLFVYMAEVNAVLAYRLWPRSLVQPPLLEADRRSLTLQATENVRRPEMRVEVSFEDDSLTVPSAERAAPGPTAPYAATERDVPAS